jgi:hypothetical protein
MYYFGFPSNTDAMNVLNFCLLYTKYYIYIQKIVQNNNLDLYACLAQIKSALDIEHHICSIQNQQPKFDKFLFIYENI